MKSIVPCAVLFALVLMAAPETTDAQQIRARVVDDASRGPLAGTTVIVRAAAGDTLASTTTAADGFFTVRVRAAGSYTVVIQRLGYAAETRQVDVAGADVLLPAFVLRAEAVLLDSIEAATRARARNDVIVGFGRASHVISGARMAQLEQRGAQVTTAIRELPPVRMRTIQRYRDSNGRYYLNYICVEVTRKMSDMATMSNPTGAPPSCDPVVLVLDGIVMGDPHEMIKSLNLNTIESIEVLQPVDAGARYGMQASAVGALVIWTRGNGPHRSDARNGG